MLALRQEITDCLLDINHLLHLARHPNRRLDIQYRPSGLNHARRKLFQHGLRISLLENLFLPSDGRILATRQVVGFSSVLFCLDRIAAVSGDLWTQVYAICTKSRRNSVYFKPDE